MHNRQHGKTDGIESNPIKVHPTFELAVSVDHINEGKKNENHDGTCSFFSGLYFAYLYFVSYFFLQRI